MLKKAKQIAENTHFFQTDKSGKPYIEHVRTVVSGVQTTNEKIVAYLHDAIEDSSIVIDDLVVENFSLDVIEALCAITKYPDEDYARYISRVKNNNLAKKVKIVDLKHNSDFTRLNALTNKDILRLRKYHQALHMLSDI